MATWLSNWAMTPTPTLPSSIIWPATRLAIFLLTDMSMPNIVSLPGSSFSSAKPKSSNAWCGHGDLSALIHMQSVSVRVASTLDVAIASSIVDSSIK